MYGTMVLTDQQRQRMDLWMAALRSGNFQQTRHKLHNKDGYCCLGVGCEKAQIPTRLTSDGTAMYGEAGLTTMPPREFAEWIGIDHRKGYFLDDDGKTQQRRADDFRAGSELAYLNDATGLSFDQIADLIEQYGLIQ